MGGLILGAEAEARRILKKVKSSWTDQTPVRRMARSSRPAWRDMVTATERLLGRTWSEMTTSYGDWGRDGLLAVATRHLGWRLVEVVREVPGLSYAAAAQGIRRFWTRLPLDRKMASFAIALQKAMSARPA